MAAPSIPSALNAGDVVSNAWVDAVRDGLQWLLDDRPVYRNTHVQNISDVTNTSVAFADGNPTAAWNDTPPINIGFEPKDSGTGIEATHAGVYWVGLQGRYTAAASGYRTVELLRNAGVDTTIRARTLTLGTSAETVVFAGGLREMNAGDYFDMQVYQNSGGALNGCSFTFTAYWVNSSAS